MTSVNYWLTRDRVADFNSYKMVYSVEGRLVNETPLRIGLGRGEQLESATDLPVIKIRRNGSDVPYIPGSSLKGVFRSHVERLAAAIYGLQAVHSPFDTDRAREEYEKNQICAVCSIFGSTMLASHVVVKDSFPLSNPTLMMKTGIGINRDFAGVQPGIGPFVEEFVPPGVEWSFSMKVINIDLVDRQGDDPRPQLIRQLISSLIKGELQVGGRKSIGAGIISLKDLKILKRTIAPTGEIKEVEVKI